MDSIRHGIRAAQIGLLVNGTLVLVKLVAGIVGNTYALVADAAESSTDIISSLVVWMGLRISAQPADADHPFGHGKAEPIAAAVVALLLLVVALGVAAAAIAEIRYPGAGPASWTLGVAAGVIIVKETLFRRVLAVGEAVDSTAVRADAWHHRSDAISSGAAFIGIAIALWGGPGWESADDWAALVAAAIIVVNGFRILRPAVHDLMDRMPGDNIVEPVARAATDVPGVEAIEKLKVRRAGMGYYVDIHVQADPAMSLYDAHELSGRVKGAIRAAVPSVLGVLVHMEPYRPDHLTGGPHLSRSEP